MNDTRIKMSIDNKLMVLIISLVIAVFGFLLMGDKDKKDDYIKCARVIPTLMRVELEYICGGKENYSNCQITPEMHEKLVEAEKHEENVCLRLYEGR